jgi:hypothetical protein
MRWVEFARASPRHKVMLQWPNGSGLTPDELGSSDQFKLRFSYREDSSYRNIKRVCIQKKFALPRRGDEYLIDAIYVYHINDIFVLHVLLYRLCSAGSPKFNNSAKHS